MNLELRRYAAVHTIDIGTVAGLRALVTWNGKNWNVSLNDEPIPDCCDTIEEAYTAAEAEIRRRFPEHDCGIRGCRTWHQLSEA